MSISASLSIQRGVLSDRIHLCVELIATPQFNSNSSIYVVKVIEMMVLEKLIDRKPPDSERNTIYHSL